MCYGGHVGRDQIAERAAGDELHSVERCAIWPAAGFVDGNDPRVLEASGDQRLAQEAHLAEVASRDQLLDRDVAAQVAIVRTGDAAEAASAVLVNDLVAIGIAQLRGGGRTRVCAADTGMRIARAGWLGARGDAERVSPGSSLSFALTAAGPVGELERELDSASSSWGPTPGPCDPCTNLAPDIAARLSKSWAEVEQR